MSSILKTGSLPHPTYPKETADTMLYILREYRRKNPQSVRNAEIVRQNLQANRELAMKVLLEHGNTKSDKKGRSG